MHTDACIRSHVPMPALTCLSKLGNPIWAWGGGHAQRCLYTQCARRAYAGAPVSAERSPYINRCTHVAIWDLNQMFCSRHPLNSPPSLLRRVWGLVGAVFGPTFIGGSWRFTAIGEAYRLSVSFPVCYSPDSPATSDKHIAKH